MPYPKVASQLRESLDDLLLTYPMLLVPSSRLAFLLWKQIYVNTWVNKKLAKQITKVNLGPIQTKPKKQ